MDARRLFVDGDLPVPIFAQLCEQILAALSRGDLRDGDRLPSVRDVAAELALNPNTVNRAYAELEREGVVETRRGLGTYVRARRGRAAAANVPRLEEIAERFVGRARALGYRGAQIVSAVRVYAENRRSTSRRSKG